MASRVHRGFTGGGVGLARLARLLGHSERVPYSIRGIRKGACPFDEVAERERGYFLQARRIKADGPYWPVPGQGLR